MLLRATIEFVLMLLLLFLLLLMLLLLSLLLMSLSWPCLLLLFTINVHLGLQKADIEFLWWVVVVVGGVLCSRWGCDNTIIHWWWGV